MQIRVRKLRENLTLLQSLVPKKPTLEVLSNVLIKDGVITATDLENRVSLRLDEAHGSCLLLPYKSAMEFLKYVPGDELLTVELNEKKLNFSWDSGSASFDTKDAEDYPPLELKEPTSSGLLDGDLLVTALATAVPYCAVDSTRPVLSGVTLYLGNVLQIAGADGFRMSFQSLNLSYLNPVTKTIVIPAGTIAILQDLWKKEPSQVGLAGDLISQITAKREVELNLYGEENINTMEMKFGRVTLVSRLIAGNPPDHLSLLNNFEEPIKVRFMGPDMYNAVRRVRGLAKEAAGIARLVWDESRMTVSAVSGSSGGEVKAVFPVEASSTPGRIAININYLTDYFADKPGMVTMGKSSNTGAPALFHYGNRPIVAVMPMQVQWGDEPSAEQPPADSETAATEENPGPEIGEEYPVKHGDEERDNKQTEPVKKTRESEPTKKHRGRLKKP